MSDDEGFVARWSRRKIDAAKTAPDAPKPAAEPASEATLPVDAAPPVDPATLPSIDLIGAGTDIKAFLARGVPQALTQAALRRAWATDPAIRDFVGLSENSWDFNAVGGVPGFGPIDAEEVQKILSQVLGAEPGHEDPEAMPSRRTAAPVALTTTDPATGPQDKKEDPAAAAVAADKERAERSEPPGQPPATGRPRHGGALPA